MEITLVAIDLAKSIFQMAALNRANKVSFNRKVGRSKLICAVRQLPTGICIAMERCTCAQ